MGRLFAAVVLTLLVSVGAQASIVEPNVYRLEGTWLVGGTELVGGTSSNGKSAPDKDTNPAVYSGLEAAKTIFGESSTGYAISTNPLFTVFNNAQSPYVFKPGDLVYIRSDGTYTINGVLQEVNDVPLSYEVNKKTYLDGWGDDTTYLTAPGADQDFSRDVDPPGYNFPQFQGAAYSAWVSDHPAGAVARNYAFVPVPEPQSWTLMLGGAVLLALFRAARKTCERI